jgi:ectoine hydroxylase-related dioxygenase (phytanoyl-CoA dioxygenase family)
MDSADHVDEVIKYGFTIFENLLSKDVVVTLREIAKSARVDSNLYIFGRELFKTQPGVVLPIIGCTRVLKVLELIFGPFVQLDSFSVIGISVGCSANIYWHRDPYGSVPRGTEFQRPLAMNMLIYLQDLDTSVGPLRVIPGSHRSPLVMDAEQREQPYCSERLIVPKAGDGVLIHNNLVHSRTRNNSAADRIHISIIYNLTCMRSTLDFRLPEFREIIMELEKHRSAPCYLRLFGEDRRADVRYNSGFLNNDEESWQRWIDEELI